MFADPSDIIQKIAYDYSGMKSRPIAGALPYNNKVQVGTLVRDIYKLFKITNQDGGSSPDKSFFPDQNDAFKELGKCGLYAKWNIPYDRDEVVHSLLNSVPVLISASSSKITNIHGQEIEGSGHAWLLDGYKYTGGIYQNTTKVWGKASDPNYRREEIEKSYLTQPSMLIHCNWGWAKDPNPSGGYISYDGWFNEGVWQVTRKAGTQNQTTYLFNSNIVITPDIHESRVGPRL